MFESRLGGALALTCLVSLAPTAAAATRASGLTRHPVRPASSSRIVVRGRPGTSAASLRKALLARGLSLGARIPHTRLFAVRTNSRSPASAIHTLDRSALVAGATSDYVRHAFDTPNDPYFESAESYFDTIRMPQAWDLSHGSRAITIAVVDTGVAPVGDLARQLQPGRNVVADNTDTRDDSTVSHGTLVAGIAAATTNNGIGIAGVAWDVKVLPVKVLNANGAGTDFQVATGIVWAVDHGARIVNLSLGGPPDGSTLCNAVDYAVSKDVLVVAAAGNFHSGQPMYPAACPGAVGVSATDTNGDFAYFSSYGSAVSLAAPGVAIMSTRSNDSFGAESGTSFAAPMVAGVAALVEAQHPGWSASDVATQLEQTAQDRGPVGFDPYYGYGVLDAYAALGGPAQNSVPPRPDSLEPNDRPDQATPLSRTTTMTATIAPEGDVDWYATSVRLPGILEFHVEASGFNSFAGPNFGPVLQVYDHDQNLLATGAGGWGQGATVKTPVVAAGRYYLRVANTGGARSPGSYSVTVRNWRSRGVIWKVAFP